MSAPATDEQIKRRRELLGKTLSQIKLPGDRTLAHLGNNELVKLGEGLGVTGLAHDAGYLENAKAFARHLEKLAVIAGERAIAEFLARAP